MLFYTRRSEYKARVAKFSRRLNSAALQFYYWTNIHAGSAVAADFTCLAEGSDYFSILASAYKTYGSASHLFGTHPYT
jgi:hypothetical protein